MSTTQIDGIVALAMGLGRVMAKGNEPAVEFRIV